MTESRQSDDNWRDHYGEGWDAWYPGFLAELSEYLKTGVMKDMPVDSSFNQRCYKGTEYQEVEDYKD